MTIGRISGLMTKKIDDEFIVFDTHKGRVYELNPVAEVIWNYLRKPRTIKELTDEIVGKFNISSIKAKKDTGSFIEKYQDRLFSVKKI